ncbi:MAG: trehalase family glycosidase [Planctomycetota bacterium]
MNIKADCLFPVWDNSSRTTQFAKTICWKCELSDSLRVAINLGPKIRPGNWRNYFDFDEIILEITGLDSQTHSSEWLGDAIVISSATQHKTAVLMAWDNVLIYDGPLSTKQKTTIHFSRNNTTPIDDAGTLTFESDRWRFIAPALKAGCWRKDSGRTYMYQHDTTDRRRLIFIAAPDLDTQTEVIKALAVAETLDLEPKLHRSRAFLDNAPACDWFSENQRRLWRHAWMLHRIERFESVGFFKHPWQSVGRFFYHEVCLAGWDNVHNTHCNLWYDSDYAADLMRNHITLCRDSDNMMGSGALHSGPLYDTSQPMLWADCIWHVYQKTHDNKLLQDTYLMAVRNLTWWQKNRSAMNGKLFGWRITKGGNGGSGYDNTPRFGNEIDAINHKGFRGATIDLSSQFAGHYEALASMAEVLGYKDDSKKWQTTRTTLIDNINAHLWDEKSSFYYDYNEDTNTLVKIKTSASFWPMVWGVASQQQAKRMVEHLLNPKEFWTPLPVPTVAIDEPTFSLDMWRGPTWISQNFWIARGLKRYGYHKVAAELAIRTLNMLTSVFMKYNKVYEFYNPFEPDVDKLTRKNIPTGPIPYINGSQTPLQPLILEA